MGGIEPPVENLVFMKYTAHRLFERDYTWSIYPVRQYQFTLGTVAVVMGGNVRVVLEDNLYLRGGKLLTSNKEAVEKIPRIIKEEFEIDIATPNDARRILKLKGRENTRF